MNKLLMKHWFYAVVVISTAAGSHVTADDQLDPVSPRLATANPDRGQRIFLQCKACHVTEKGANHTVGPNLWGVVDRPVGSLPDFTYSSSLKEVGGKWGYEQLNRYLFDPRGVAPGTRMIFPGIKNTHERPDVIAYLRTLDDQPAPLPQQSSKQSHPNYGGAPAGAQTEVRDWRGLPPGPGREEVFYSCSSCHSLMLVTQQAMSRDSWDETLEWMVEEQGMAEIENATTRDLILDYLSNHFGSG